MSMEEIEASRAESREQERKLDEQLSHGEVVEIEGMTWGHGVMSSMTPPSTLWNLRLELVAWKVAGGPLRKLPLSITQKIDDAELKAWRAKISPDSLIRIRARLVEDNVSGKPHALLEELLDGEVTDEELVAHVESTRKPVVHNDSLFGALTKARRSGDFEGNATWAGRKVKLHLEPEGDDDLTATLEAAHALWEKQDGWAKELAAVAVEYGLSRKNESWLGEGEGAMDAETFLGRIAVKTVTVDPEGNVGFYHDDGDVFWGHTIEISGSLKEGLTYFDILG